MMNAHEEDSRITIEKPYRKNSIISRDLGEETLLYDPDTKKVHILNKTAIFIWQLCDGQHSFDDMVTSIFKDFRLNLEGRMASTIKLDVRDIINTSEAQGLVRKGEEWGNSHFGEIIRMGCKA